jgi:4-amino-4-deoxy-L-arabinose transferase-like glycosyltransferase
MMRAWARPSWHLLPLGDAWRSSWLWGLVVVPLFAFAVRLAYAALLPPTIVVTFEADPLTYDQIARNVVAGRGFTGASFYYPPGTEVPTAFWDALYPLFLAGLYAGVGHSIPAVRVAQAILGAVAVGGIFVLGRQLVRPAVGIVAAAVSAVYPFFVYYSGQLLTETLFMALVVLLFVVGFHSSSLGAGFGKGAAGAGRGWWFALLGGIAGLAALCRAEVFYVGPVFALWCAWRTSKFPWRRLRLGAIAIAAMVAVMLPWGLRNQATQGQLILTTTKLGYNLYKYYHPTMTADQTVRVVPFPDFGDRTEPQREALLREQGLRFMSQDPPRTLWFMANKLVLLFKLTPSNEVNRQYALVSLASYGLLLPFMLGGGYLALRRGGRFLPVLAYVLFSVATKAAVFAGIRLRMQIEPFLILLAAFAIVTLASRLIESSAVSSRLRFGSGSPAGAAGGATLQPRRTV